MSKLNEASLRVYDVLGCGLTIRRLAPQIPTKFHRPRQIGLGCMEHTRGPEDRGGSSVYMLQAHHGGFINLNLNLTMYE